MKVSCQGCNARYSVPDEKVLGKRARMKCRRCGASITIDGTKLGSPESPKSRGSSSAETLPRPQSKGEEATTTPSAGSGTTAHPRESEEPAGVPDAGWYVVIGGKQGGPLSLSDLEEAARSGRLTPKTYVWRAGYEGWMPVAKVPALAKRLNLAVAGGAPTTEASRRSPASTNGVPAERAAARDLVDSETISQEDGDLDALFRDSSLLQDDVAGVPQPGPSPARRRSENQGPRDNTFGGSSEGGSSSDDGEDPFKAALAREAAASAVQDPFSLVPCSDVDGPPREMTQMFILASGVKKQKSPVRVALFVAGLGAVIFALVLLASQVGGVNLAGLVQPGSERREATAWESSGTATDLRDRLLGIRAEDPSAARVVRPVGPAMPGQLVPEETEAELRLQQERDAERRAVDPERRDMLADLYSQRERGSITVRTRRDGERSTLDAANVPIDPEVIHRRLAEAQPAFESCLQQEIRRNPTFRGGRLELVLTVAPSGVVREARLSDRLLDQAEVGRCINRAVRRIMLPSFASEEPIDIVVPFVMTPGLPR